MNVAAAPSHRKTFERVGLLFIQHSLKSRTDLARARAWTQVSVFVAGNPIDKTPTLDLNFTTSWHLTAMGIFDRVLLWLPPKMRRRLWRLYYRLRQPFTPFALRRSLGLLRVIHADGYHESFPAARACLHLARLLFRLPWYHPRHLPPPPSDIVSYPPRQYFQTHHTGLLAERQIPLWR